MSYLVFWSVNAQRKSHFMREDRIHCVSCFYPDVHNRGGRRVARVAVRGRTKYLIDPIVFDESTTPPTLKNDTITNVAYWSKKNPRFPKFYISPVGHIRESATDRLVISAAEERA